MKRAVCTLFAAVLIAGGGFGATSVRVREYRHRVVGRGALARSAGTAAFGQLRNSPHEWGRGPAGYAKRFGSGVGTHAVRTAIELGVGAWRHEDNRYYRSNRHGTWPRLKYAVANTFVAHKTNRPGRTPAVGRISGAMGAGLISRAWQPASAAGLGAGVASGGIMVGADVGMNVAREFWPRHPKRKIRRER